MFMASRFLTRLKRNLANINRSYLSLGKSCIEKRFAENRAFAHVKIRCRLLPTVAFPDSFCLRLQSG